MNNNPFSDFESELEVKVSNTHTDVDKVLIELQEREQRWKERRIGKITSSCLSAKNMMEFKKDGTFKTKASIDYLLEKLHQKQTGKDEEETFAKAFQWGHLYEDEALQYYKKVTGIDMLSGTNDFDEILFVDNILEGFGDSPDGVTRDRKGVLEIKCPINGANHYRAFQLEEYNEDCDYFWQCIGHMIDPQVEWCDFVSYDPRFEDGHPNKIKIIRINRNEVYAEINELISKLAELIDLLNREDLNGILKL